MDDPGAGYGVGGEVVGCAVTLNGVVYVTEWNAGLHADGL
jgi:hypothetical protein